MPIVRLAKDIRKYSKAVGTTATFKAGSTVELTDKELASLPKDCIEGQRKEGAKDEK